MEIKFRAWHKKEKKWIGDNYLDYLCIGKDDVIVLVQYIPTNHGDYKPKYCIQLNNNETDNLIIVQFTGLPEINNKQLYSKDIVRWVDTEGTEYIKEINWNKILGCWNIGQISYQSLVKSGYFQTKLELIGNSIENPELLK